MKEVVLTEEGLQKVTAELAALKERRKSVINRIQSAKEFGDLSENAEYDDARNEQSFVEGRIQELDDMIKRARVVSKKHGSGTIGLGSKVTVKCEGESNTYELVGANESDPSLGKISIDSPIGKALMGASKGEAVMVATPGGKMEYKVLNVA